MMQKYPERTTVLAAVLVSILFLSGVKAVYGAEYVFILKWGSFGSGDGQLYYPRNVAIDNEGYVYVADTDNHR
ncbi:MAG: SBBP repeat-containing protein, partial [Candidatus Bathyarchaeota archaeon]